MTTTAPAPNRASLLSGLRTGGVRSVSGGFPQTAAPGATFSLPHQPPSQLYADEETDFVAPINGAAARFMQQYGGRQMPMTAAVDGGFASQQQSSQRGMNPNSVPFSPGMNGQYNIQNQQAIQMQMLQAQMMQLHVQQHIHQQEQYMQALAVQQAQAQLAQQQQQQQQQASAPQHNRRSVSFNPPATAGPMQSSFQVLPGYNMGGSDRRASHGLSSNNSISNISNVNSMMTGMMTDDIPKTAALGGKFGARLGQENVATDVVPQTPSYGATTVISGGTSLGTPTTATFGPSKSDSASTWRRGGNNNSVLSRNSTPSGSPSVRVTPPPGERREPSPPGSNLKAKPQPLRFSVTISKPTVDAVAVDSDDVCDDASSASSKSAGNSTHTSDRRTRTSNSSPTTSSPPLSPREEASKKLYEGLGIGRPGPAQGQVAAPAVQQVQKSLIPVRQPRGPPSGADELGPKNFASRIRRKAIGGLEVLMSRHGRDNVVEAY